jgi:hypothetical protein
MRKPKKSDIARWVRRAALDIRSFPYVVDHARSLLALHGLGLDGKPDPRIAADAAATGARLPRGTVRVP